MEPLHQALSDLPANNLTVKMLKVVGNLTGAEWENVTDLAQLVRKVTGETDETLVQTIGERAVELYADPRDRYQRAARIYGMVDRVDKLVGVAAIAGQVGQRVSFLGFLDKLVPKDEKLQAIDAGAKLLAELAAFTAINGIPGDSVGDFARSLANAAHEDRLRMATWVVVEGVLPFGPDFLQVLEQKMGESGAKDLASSTLFQRVGELLPETTPDQRKGLLLRTLTESAGWMQGLVSSRGLTREGIGQKLSSIIDVGNGGLDFVAAAIDAGTNYFQHTGTQSVARQIVKRAYGEI